MTEREKMNSGKIYDPFSEGLTEERTRAHKLCVQYNMTDETDEQKRKEILDELLPDRGKDVYLQGPIHFDYGIYTHIGDGSYANVNFTVIDSCPVNIGKNVFIGPNVSLLTPKHPLCYQDRNPYISEKTGLLTDREYSLPITIEDNCWIACGVTIIGGVTIGEGSVIGAGSLVTRSIPKGVLAFGNPCKVIRKITEEDRLINHPELF